jgi:two-component system chemotaxis sensor kinase CheA
MYIPYSNYIVYSYKTTLKQVLQTIEKQYPVLSDPARIYQEGAAGSDEYWNTLKTFRNFVESFDLTYIYFVRKYGDTYQYLFSSEDTPEAGLSLEDLFLVMDEGDTIPKSLDEAYHGGSFQISETPYTDDYGTFVSAYLPIIKDGNVIGVLGADFELSTVRDFQFKAFLALSLSILAAIATAGLLTLNVSSSLIIPIREIEKVAKDLAQKNFAVDITHFRKDEIGDIQRAILTIRDNLRQYLDDLNRQMEKLKAVVNEISAMKDSLNIGLFFMNKDFIIQDNYSKALGNILDAEDFHNARFSSLLAQSVSADELSSIETYFSMLFESDFDKTMLDEINPFAEFVYKNANAKSEKILHAGFVPVERENGEVMIMCSVYDITAKVELQRKLDEEEKRRQEEMRSLFELINVEQRVFNDFVEDAEYEFDKIEKTIKNSETSPQDALLEIYQSIHAIKSNAVILGLATFGEKCHRMETLIKEMRKREEIPFSDILYEIDKLEREKDNFRASIEKIYSFKEGARKSNGSVLIESLERTCEKVSADQGKKARFIVDFIDSEVMERGPRRVMKETLMQLARNAVYHGIEPPEERVAKGKSEIGSIYLTIRMENGNIHIKLRDDGNGIDFEKIREKGLKEGFLKREEDAADRNILLNLMFLPGFSTAKTEDVHAGRGIGLPLVLDRVKEMEGSLKIQTEPGKGTVFHIIIPFQFRD